MVDYCHAPTREEAGRDGPEVAMNDLGKSVGALLEGDTAVSLAEAKALRRAGVSVERIVTEGVESAMPALDGKCTLEQFNLLEIMLVGRAVTEVMKSLFPKGLPRRAGQGTVVVADPRRRRARPGQEHPEDGPHRQRVSCRRLRQGLSPRKAGGRRREGNAARRRASAA